MTIPSLREPLISTRDHLRILRCGTGPAAVVAQLQSALSDWDFATCSDDELAVAIRDADVVIPARTTLSADVLATATRCRLIQQMGAGVDMVDLEAARALGIPVANVPSAESGIADSVAELAVFLAIGVLRNVRQLSELVGRDAWSDVTLGRSLADANVVVVGYGGIGQALATRLLAFGASVSIITRDPERYARRPMHRRMFGLAELRRLLPTCDVLVLAIPLTDATRELIGPAEFDSLKPGACLVNVARAPLVDKEALLAALGSGRLAGAGLDVFWEEPVGPDDPIMRAPNVLLTPHIAGYTDRVVHLALKVIQDNLSRLALGRPLRNVVS